MLARRLLIVPLAIGALTGHCGTSALSAEPFGMPTVQVLFLGPEGSRMSGDEPWPGETEVKEIALPGRRNFPLSSFVRLRLTDVPGHAGQSFSSVLEISGITPRVEDYLHSNAVPVRFTAEDLDAASRGTTVMKVVYLVDPPVVGPHPAGVPPETLVSTQLKMGVDPILEADRRGTILAVLRIRHEPAPQPALPPDIMGKEPEPKVLHDPQRTTSQALVLDPPCGRVARPLRFSQIGRGPWRARRR